MIDSYPKAKKRYLDHQNKIIDYKIIKELNEAHKWPIDFICKVLKVSRAAYYKRSKRSDSDHDRENMMILDTIKDIVASNNSLFGSIKMTYAINKKLDTKYNHKRIYRLMCINDIRSNFRRKKKYNYKRSAPEVTAENILNRDFSTTRPNEKWCTDVTEFPIPHSDKKLYLSPIIDLYDDYIVHYEISKRNDNQLVFNTLDNAIIKENKATPILHDDRGFQYTTQAFKAKLESYGIIHSMSRVSKCIDNGPCENVQGIIKDMMAVLYPNIQNEEELIEAIDKTIKYYNEENPMKRFKGKTPSEVRKEAKSSKTPIIYPIPKNPGIEKFWAKIEKAKEKERQVILQNI